MKQVTEKLAKHTRKNADRNDAGITPRSFWELCALKRIALTIVLLCGCSSAQILTQIITGHEPSGTAPNNIVQVTGGAGVINKGTLTTSTVFNMPADITQHDTMFIWVGGVCTGVTWAITDNAVGGSNTYATDATLKVENASRGSTTQLFYVADAKTTVIHSSLTLTLTTTGTCTSTNIVLLQYQGLSNSAPFVQGSTNTGNSNAPATGSVTTAVANNLLLAFNYDGGAVESVSSASSAAGWSLAVGTFTSPGASAKRIVSASGTYNMTFSMTLGGNWQTIIAAFKGAGQ